MIEPLNLENLYYVYCHYRKDNGKPFYIGRGKHPKNATTLKSLYNRAFNTQKRGSYWNSVVSKYGYTIEILLDNLTLEEANKKEEEFISLYGRKSEGGALVNLTIGGDGNRGYPTSLETKAKLSKPQLSFDQKLQRDIIFEPTTGCWIWDGPLCILGNPIWCSTTTTPAKSKSDRVLFKVFKGEISNKEVLEPTCSTTNCVNPYHKTAMTLKEALKLRGNIKYGENASNSKLVESNIIEIKNTPFKKGTDAMLGRKFGVSRSLIRKVRLGKLWGHIQ